MAQDSATIDSFQFSLLDAKSDTSLSIDIHSEFQDDDKNIPLKSIDIDLNNDGYPEKLTPNEYLCGSGGCPWIIYDQRSGAIIGKIDGGILIVKKRTTNDYYIIETHWNLGGGIGTVTPYEFRMNSYFPISKFEIEEE